MNQDKDVLPGTKLYDYQEKPRWRPRTWKCPRCREDVDKRTYECGRDNCPLKR